MAKLFGTISHELDGRFRFEVDEERGDAPRFGLVGEIWLARRQCRQVIEAGNPIESDIVLISDALAEAKAPQRIPTPERPGA